MLEDIFLTAKVFGCSKTEAHRLAPRAGSPSPSRQVYARLLSLRHFHRGTGLGAFFFENPPDLWCLILILDLPSALIQRDVGLDLSRDQFLLTAEYLERQIARRLRAGIKMLVEPLLRGNHDRARAPIDPHFIFSLGPEERVALAS